MKINRKLSIIFFLTLVVIIAVTFIIKSYFEYSLEEVVSLVDKSDEIPNNIYIREESTSRLWAEGEYSICELYAKDDIIYQKDSHINPNEDSILSYETVMNYKDKSRTFINNESKEIYKYSIEGNGKENPLTDILIGFSREIRRTQGKYKYFGKVKIDEKECIKFSLTGDKSKYIYYINIEDWTVIKIEFYKKTDNDFNLWNTSLYTYGYGTVTDEDILDFDINNYPDYEYEEWDF